MASFTGLKDMFDGGGAGKSGAKFEGGGVLSALGNAVARPSGSRDRGEADMRTGFGGFARDMFNGGGFGASGETFQGGPYGGIFGGLLNSIGVRPMGYEQRGQQQLQQALANTYNVMQQGAQSAPAAPVSTPVTVAQNADVAFPNAVTGPMPSTPLGFGTPPARRAPIRAGDNVSSLYGDYVTGANMLGLQMPDERAYYRYLMTGKW